MTLLVVLASFTVALALALGYIILRNHADSSLNRLFFLMTVSIALWSTSSLLSYITDNREIMKVLFRTTVFFAGLYAAFLLHFVIEVTQSKPAGYRILQFIFYIPIIVLGVLVWTNQTYFSEFNRVNNLWSYNHQYDSPIFIFYMSYWSLYTLASVFLLIKSTFTAKYRILKKQYGILSAALGLSIFFSLFKALVFPNLFEAESQGGTLSFQLIWLFSILILVDRYRFLLPKKDAERTAILEISGYSLVVIDRQGSIQIMNREAEQLLGIRFNRIASKKINDFLHPFESLRQEMEKMQYKTWQSISSTMVIRTAKGKDIPVDIKVTLLEDKLQRRSGYLLTMKEKSKVTKLQETFRLSRREIEVLQCLVNGFTNQEIAAALFISERTVKTHVTHIFDKLGVDNRVQVIMCLREYEILSTQSSEKEVIIL